MARPVVIAVALLLAVTGCARDRVTPGGETITYATSACFGACPVYTVTLGPDGEGIFVGQRFTAVIGERRFQATPEQVRAFVAALRPYRAHGEVLMTGAPFCKAMASDMPTIDIRWQPALAAPAHLAFDKGCDGEKHRRMAAALTGAPALLQIADLIGRR